MSWYNEDLNGIEHRVPYLLLPQYEMKRWTAFEVRNLLRVANFSLVGSKSHCLLELNPIRDINHPDKSRILALQLLCAGNS